MSPGCALVVAACGGVVEDWAHAPAESSPAAANVKRLRRIVVSIFMSFSLG
jgi:hypothetical protein